MTETTAVRPKGFIRITAISSQPGNPHRLRFERAKQILSFGEAPPEHASVGAACFIDSAIGTMYVTETVEEIAQQIEAAERETE